MFRLHNNNNNNNRKTAKKSIRKKNRNKRFVSWIQQAYQQAQNQAMAPTTVLPQELKNKK